MYDHIYVEINLNSHISQLNQVSDEFMAALHGPPPTALTYPPALHLGSKASKSPTDRWGDRFNICFLFQISLVNMRFPYSSCDCQIACISSKFLFYYYLNQHTRTTRTPKKLSYCQKERERPYVQENPHRPHLTFPWFCLQMKASVIEAALDLSLSREVRCDPEVFPPVPQQHTDTPPPSSRHTGCWCTEDRGCRWRTLQCLLTYSMCFCALFMFCSSSFQVRYFYASARR